MNDQFGLAVDGDPASVTAWTQAYERYLDYSGDPIATLSPAVADDDGFALGPAFCAAYRMLAGLSPSLADVADDVSRAIRRAQSPREQVFATTVGFIADGQFAAAAAALDAWTAETPCDLPAWKLAHDLYLHNGDGAGRLRSAEASLRSFPAIDRNRGVVAGHLAFALEEVGRYPDAERRGEEALTINPGDAWGRHALAHVYESQSRHCDMLRLLVDGLDDWQERTLFSNHLWWHLALRHLREGDLERATDLLDTRLISVTPFGLCDATSLVWRLELAGADVNDRWPALADRWADAGHLFDSAFVNVHAAYAIAAAVAGADDGATESGDTGAGGPGRAGAAEPGDAGRGEKPRSTAEIAARFTASTATAPSACMPAENATTFARVARPIGEAFGMLRAGRPGGCAVIIRSLLGDLHHLGGSVIQRQVIVDTMDAIEHEGFRG